MIKKTFTIIFFAIANIVFASGCKKEEDINIGGGEGWFLDCEEDIYFGPEQIDTTIYGKHNFDLVISSYFMDNPDKYSLGYGSKMVTLYGDWYTLKGGHNWFNVCNYIEIHIDSNTDINERTFTFTGQSNNTFCTVTAHQKGKRD